MLPESLAAVDPGVPVEFRRVDVGAVALNVALAGPEDGPPVVLLHGFPEGWFGWRAQIGPLARAGFRVIAPDQRGYATSDRPRAVADYRLDAVTVDAVRLIEALGHERATVVGHDWGGLVAWWAAVQRPERVERLAILNAPHPVAFRQGLRRYPSQLLRSWYAFYFQVPWLPEAGLLAFRGRSLANGLRATSRPGTFPEPVLDAYRAAWSEPGAMRSMIHWYRAALRYAPAPPADPRVHQPALVLWGPDDRFIKPEFARLSFEFCDAGRFEWIEGATHWLQHEQPDRVNRMLLDFLAG